MVDQGALRQHVYVIQTVCLKANGLQNAEQRVRALAKIVCLCPSSSMLNLDLHEAEKGFHGATNLQARQLSFGVCEATATEEVRSPRPR